MYLARPGTVADIAELLLNAGLGMDASPMLHLKSVMAALPEFAASVAENVMLRCETTLVMEPKLGVVATAASEVKAVQLLPSQPRTRTLKAVFGGYRVTLKRCPVMLLGAAHVASLLNLVCT